jgi:Na+/H+ antiporter NhaD/arsenite permease-like protein
MSEQWAFRVTWVVFALTYAGLAWGKVPGLRTDRAGIAWAGAAVVLATGLLGFDKAVASIDFATLALLLGMMVLVGALRISGFFTRLAGWALARVRGPAGLLAATMALAGVLSAFLVNDVVCLALTPLVLHLARRLRLDPKPHLVGLALASNIGSVATLTGNPQNMIVGSLSRISYLRFAAKLAPVAASGLVVGFLVTAWVFRASLRTRLAEEPRLPDYAAVPGAWGRYAPNAAEGEPPDTGLLLKGLAVTLGAVALFFAGAPLEVVALGAAAIMLLGRVKPEAVYREVDWELLVMFAGLFVVVRSFEVHVVRAWGLDGCEWLTNDPVGHLSLVTAALSNLVSNVPAVLLFPKVIAAMPAGDQEVAWLAVAMSSTLAGNLTVLGSVANLIVLEGARREGTKVTLMEYCKAGIPVTLLTLALGVAWLWLARY